MPEEYEYSSKGIVASNIKRLMREKGVIASDVCRALGIPNATFSDWINGKTYPRIKQLEKLADYFEVSKSEIVDIPIDRDDPIYKAAKEETRRRREEEEDDPHEVRMIARAGKKMTPEKRQQMLEVLKTIFPEEFKDDEP